MGNWLEVAGFGGVCQGPAPGQAGFGGRGQLHGAHGVGGALLLRAQLALVLGQLPVQGDGLGSKQGQVLRAAVPLKNLRGGQSPFRSLLEEALKRSYLHISSWEPSFPKSDKK